MCSVWMYRDCFIKSNAKYAKKSPKKSHSLKHTNSTFVVSKMPKKWWCPLWMTPFTNTPKYDTALNETGINLIRTYQKHYIAW